MMDLINRLKGIADYGVQIRDEDGNTVPLQMRTVCCYGGGPPTRDIANTLRYGIEICVGTPGRMMDLINRDMLKLNRVTFFILDEADNLLHHGFLRSMEAINKMIRRDKQCLLWSAT